MGTGKKRVTALAAALALGLGIAACGGDDDETTSASEESASAETVTLTTGDTADGYSWVVEPTPAAETKTVKYVNDSDEQHELIFARINEGYTVEEAYELQGRKGSAELMAQGGAKPGTTSTVEVKGEIEPGNYAMLCPIPGHYQQGQLEEFEIQ